MRKECDWLKDNTDEDIVENGPLEFDGQLDGLEVVGNSDRGYYIGRSWKNVGDEETGKEFKEKVEKSLEKFGINGDICTHEDAWYDG
jgi:hypothetical protein